MDSEDIYSVNQYCVAVVNAATNFAIDTSLGVDQATKLKVAKPHSATEFWLHKLEGIPLPSPDALESVFDVLARLRATFKWSIEEVNLSDSMSAHRFAARELSGQLVKHILSVSQLRRFAREIVASNLERSLDAEVQLMLPNCEPYINIERRILREIFDDMDLRTIEKRTNARAVPKSQKHRLAVSRLPPGAVGLLEQIRKQTKKGRDHAVIDRVLRELGRASETCMKHANCESPLAD